MLPVSGADVDIAPDAPINEPDSLQSGGVPGINDPRAISGPVIVIRNGLRYRNATAHRAAQDDLAHVGGASRQRRSSRIAKMIPLILRRSSLPCDSEKNAHRSDAHAHPQARSNHTWQRFRGPPLSQAIARFANNQTGSYSELGSALHRASIVEIQRPRPAPRGCSSSR